MIADRTPGGLNFDAEPQQTALEACARLVAHWDSFDDWTLEQVAALDSEHAERGRLILAARRALEQEGYR